MGSQEEIEQIIRPIDKMNLFFELADFYGGNPSASTTSVRMSKLIISHFAALQYFTGNRDSFSVELYKDLFIQSKLENIAEIGAGMTPLLPNLKKLLEVEFNEFYIGGIPPFTATKRYNGLFPHAIDDGMNFDLIMSIGAISPGGYATQSMRPQLVYSSQKDYLSNHPHAHAITLGLGGPSIPHDWTNGVPGLFYLNPQDLKFDELGTKPGCTDMLLVGRS